MFRLVNRVSGRQFSTSFTTQAAKLSVPPENLTVEEFLTKIGRNAKEHVEAFPTWESLFQTRGPGMKEKGIDVKLRRYIMNWTHKYSIDPSIKLKHIPEGKKFHGGERKKRDVLSREAIEKRQELRERAEAYAKEHNSA